MNEKMKIFVQAVPMLQAITGVNAAIGVWDKDGVVLEFVRARGLDLNFEVGTRINNPDVGLYRVLRSGKAEVEEVPKEVFGAAIEAIITPVFDGNEVVGAITYAFSSEVRDRISENIERLSGYVENTSESISEVTDEAQGLKSNMNNVQAITEGVLSKLEDALSVVEEIKQNAKLSNILALNASIESARAGEAGKGFAVVSDEMRKFSRMSAEASEKINSTLAEITKVLDTAKNNIAESVNIANNQAVSVAELGSVFRQVSETATQILKDTKLNSSL